MKYAVKISSQPVFAYELGKCSQAEEQMIQNGVIKRHPDGTYELFSLETVNGSGEMAVPGDFFKYEEIDGRYYAYPIQREHFLETHTLISGDEYQQRIVPLPVWHVEDPDCPEMDFLLEHRLITIDQDDPDRYFNAHLRGTTLSAPKDATVVFYKIDHLADGSIKDITFNFVAHEYFKKNYRYC